MLQLHFLGVSGKREDKHKNALRNFLRSDYLLVSSYCSASEFNKQVYLSQLQLCILFLWQLILQM